MTIFELIEELEKLRCEHGGGTDVHLRDNDTGWLIPINTVTFSDDEDGAIIVLKAQSYSTYLR